MEQQQEEQLWGSETEQARTAALHKRNLGPAAHLLQQLLLLLLLLLLLGEHLVGVLLLLLLLEVVLHFLCCVDQELHCAG